MSSSKKEELLRMLIADRESTNADFKLSLDFNSERGKFELAKDISSFANAIGGFIVVGIEDETRIPVGIDKPLEHDKIVQSITDQTDPPVAFAADTLQLDGKLIGLIRIPKGKHIHQVRKDRSVYIRRDGINYKATPQEVVTLTDQREHAARTRLTEPEHYSNMDNRIHIFPDQDFSYRKTEKEGTFRNLSECPVFLPDYSQWVSTPEFGNTQGALLLNCPFPSHLRHDDFVSKIKAVEERLSQMGRYLDNSPVSLYWTISSDGMMCYGCGSDTLLQALNDGELGVVCLASCGEFRGANWQRSFLMLITGYCKARIEDVTVVQEPEVDLYLSAIPVTADWSRSLLGPFLDEERLPFNMFSYELVHPRLRVWSPRQRGRSDIQIKGVMRRYRYFPKYDYQIGAAITDTNWFDGNMYVADTEWESDRSDQDKDSFDRAVQEIKNAQKGKYCPLGNINECAISVTNPTTSYEEIAEGRTKGVFPPLIKHLELELTGFNVHILGINSTPVQG